MNRFMMLACVALLSPMVCSGGEPETIVLSSDAAEKRAPAAHGGKFGVVSVNAQDIGLADAVSLIGMTAGTQVLYDYDSLTGRVDLVANNVPADQFLIRVLGTRGFAVVDWHGVYVIRTKKQVAAANEKPVTKMTPPSPSEASVNLAAVAMGLDEAIRIAAVAAVGKDAVVNCPSFDTDISFTGSVSPLAFLKALSRLKGMSLTIEGKTVSVRPKKRPRQ